MLAICFTNAQSLVAHANAYIRVLFIAIHSNLRAFWGIFDRIAQKITEYRIYFFPVRHNYDILAFPDIYNMINPGMVDFSSYFFDQFANVKGLLLI